MNGELPLRDIHLPDSVAWWPPAPGWWLLPLLIAGAILGVRWYRRRHGARHRMREQALRELEHIETRFGRRDDERQTLQHLSMLLRRVAVNRYPRERVASLTGQRWLQFLDGVTGGTGFSEGPGRALADAPYKPAAAANIPDLLDLCRHWLEAEFSRKIEPVPAGGVIKGKAA
jgi:hypothetical protein